MGVYSTLMITRSSALAKLTEYRKAQGFVGEDDETLEAFMNHILEPKLYNCSIVPDNEENDDFVLG